MICNIYEIVVLGTCFVKYYNKTFFSPIYRQNPGYSHQINQTRSISQAYFEHVKFELLLLKATNITLDGFKVKFKECVILLAVA